MSTVRYLGLKDSHPTMIKLKKLADLARELGITIYWNNETMCVEDASRSRELPPLLIEYRDTRELVAAFPPTFDYRVIFDNPELLKQREIKDQEFLRQKSEEALLKQERSKNNI